MTGVAIVIPMLNEAAGLPRLLRSLAALEPPPAEVLAVDGGSADASVAIAEAAGLLVVRHETRGRAAAINRGVQEATAPIICVLHADTLLPDDAVAVMRRVLADPGTALAGFTSPAQRAGPGPLGDQLPQLDQDLVRAAAVPAATLPARRAAAIRRPRHVLPPRRFPGHRRL
jgi:glycosyltransferase involved in cell wall biosynthesis